MVSAVPFGDRHPIVGREREQAQLRASLAHAIGGHGSLVLVSGEAGIGKTSLVVDLLHEAAERECLALTGACYDLTTTPPYGPWIEITRDYPWTDDSLPDLPDQFRQGGGMAGIDSQEELFELVRAFFAAVSSQRPLVLVLEDLHWADPASLEALRYLGRALSDAAILLVVTYRDDELTRRHELYPLLPVLVRESRAQRIHLNPLDQQAIRELVESRYDLGDTDVARLVAHLVERSEGNPFFAGEILQGLEDEQVLEASSEGWRLGLLEHVHVPALLRQVLDVRFSRLSRETRAALQIASVIGHTVPLLLWQEVGGFDDQALDRVITEALEARVLEEVATADALQFHHALLREALYESLIFGQRRVVHRQIAEALSATPNPDPDEVAHHFQHAADPRAVSWLIRAGIRAEAAFALQAAAHYYDAAQVLLEAEAGSAQARGWLLLHIGYLLRYVNQERSLAYLEEVDRVARQIDDPILTAYSRQFHGLLQGNQADIRSAVTDFESAVATFDQVTPEQKERTRQAIDLLFASIDFPDRRANLGNILFKTLAVPASINTLTQTYVMWLAIAGRFNDAKRVGERYVGNVSAATDDYLLTQFCCREAYTGLAQATDMLGHPNEARRWRALALEAYEAIGHHQMAATMQWNDLGSLLTYATDQVAERRRIVQAGIVAAERSGQYWGADPRAFGVPLDVIEGRWRKAYSMGMSVTGPVGGRRGAIQMWVYGWLAREQDELRERAWEYIGEILPDRVTTQPGDRWFSLAVFAQRLAAELSLDAGDLEATHAWIVAHDRWLERSGAVCGLAEAQLLWTRYSWTVSNNPDTARRHASLALEHASDPRQPLVLLAAHRTLGQLDIEAGRYDEAAEHLQTALDLAQRCEAPYEQALTLLALAELAIATDDHDQARRLLRNARATCKSLDARRSLKRIDDLEHRLGRPTGDHPAGLSNREVEVLEQAATGMTNAEIGEALYISPRTVAQHLRSVYNKLGVNSRAAAVGRWAELTRN